MTERKIVALEMIAQELTHIRVLMEARTVIKNQKEREVIQRDKSFHDFMDEYKGLNLDNMLVSHAYTLYTTFCEQRDLTPISRNKFSRVIHKLGYVTELKVMKKGAKPVRVFVETYVHKTEQQIRQIQ